MRTKLQVHRDFAAKLTRSNDENAEAWTTTLRKKHDQHGQPRTERSRKPRSGGRMRSTFYTLKHSNESDENFCLSFIIECGFNLLRAKGLFCDVQPKKFGCVLQHASSFAFLRERTSPIRHYRTQLFARCVIHNQTV